jgi:hypothetical protein
MCHPEPVEGLFLELFDKVQSIVIAKQIFSFFLKAIAVDLFKVRPAFHYKSSLRCGLFIPIRFKIGRFLLLLKVE